MDKTKKYPLGPVYPDVILTQREVQCVTYFLKNYSDEVIAKRLMLSPRTVGFYITNVQKLLNCTSRETLIKKLCQVHSINHIKIADVITE